MEHSPKRASSRVTDALAGVAPFSALDEGSRDRMAQSCRVLSLDAHEVLLRDGQIPTNVYILMEGCLTRSFVTLEGKGVILNHTRPVTAFCCAAAVDGSAHIGTVEAWEPSTVVAVPIAAVARALEKSPAFAVVVARNLARSSVRQTETIRELMFPVPVRLARLLCRRAEGDGAAELDMSCAALAEMLATVPETLSRALGVLKRRGMVEVSGRHVRVLDEVALRSYAQL